MIKTKVISNLSFQDSSVPKDPKAKELPALKSRSSNPASIKSAPLQIIDPKPAKSRTKAAVAPVGLSPLSDSTKLS
jgi:hypothetical protein